MAIHIGCGSWRDKEYVGVLYPKKLPEERRLEFYAKWFDRVELNATYHALPKVQYVQNWEAQTPDGFIFDVKLPKVFSDNPAKAAEGGWCERALETIRPFIDAKKFGVFLLTLLPSFTTKKHRLEELDETVKKFAPHRVAVELRSRDWVEGERLEETLAFFRSRELAWVALDLPQIDSPKLLPAIDEVTNPSVAYMRLHGRNPDYLSGESAAEKHSYAYTEDDLTEIAARIRILATKAKDVHVSLNNHAKDFAPKAAIALRRILKQPVRSDVPELTEAG